VRRDGLRRGFVVCTGECPLCPDSVHFFNEHNQFESDHGWFNCDGRRKRFGLGIDDHDCQFVDHVYAGADESELAPESLLRQRDDGDGDIGDAEALAR
jgi:hypothetical protein